ncbi:MAG: PaaI family thioesterase [Rhizomicrobium sp.]|jgi:uncharacterized protein (TIGR00369 family)
MTDKPWLRLAQNHMHRTPFFAHLNGEVVGFGPGRATMRLPYGPHLVGNPDTGVVHGGAITALLDHTAGASVMAALNEPMAIATLDLRIDYMKPATPGEAITAEVQCLKVTHEVAFVRGSAYQSSPEDPVAICTGAFMLIRNVPNMMQAGG